MEIKVLGPGCMNCKTLEKRTYEALAELGKSATVTKVEDYAEIASFGIASTPGLVIDGEVMLSGRVPTKQAIMEFIQARSN